MKKLIALVLLCVGCVKTDVMKLSPTTYPAVPADSVAVFLRADDRLGAYDEVALIDVYMEGSCSGELCQDREDFLNALKERAGGLGANGIVLSESQFSSLGNLSQGTGSIQVLDIHTLGDVPEVSDVVLLTPSKYPPVSSDSVTVFLFFDEAPAEYEQLALIDAYEIGRCSEGRCPRLSEIVSKLKDRAGAIGANGIIVDGELANIPQVRQGETSVRVIAIRF